MLKTGNHVNILRSNENTSFSTEKSLVGPFCYCDWRQALTGPSTFSMVVPQPTT